MVMAVNHGPVLQCNDATAMCRKVALACQKFIVIEYNVSQFVTPHPHLHAGMTLQQNNGLGNKLTCVSKLPHGSNQTHWKIVCGDQTA